MAHFNIACPDTTFKAEAPPKPHLKDNHYKVDNGPEPGIVVHPGIKQITKDFQVDGIFVEKMKYERDEQGGYFLNHKKEAKVSNTFASLFFNPQEALQCVAAIAHILRTSVGMDQSTIEDAVRVKPQ